MNQESTENPTYSELFADLWGSLTESQRRYCIARLSTTSKKDAAEMIDLTPNTVYHWPDNVDTAVEMLRTNMELSALGIIQFNATKAAHIKTSGLDSDDEKIRQGVASEILDRVMGRPTQRSEVSGPDGGAIDTIIKVTLTDD